MSRVRRLRVEVDGLSPVGGGYLYLYSSPDMGTFSLHLGKLPPQGTCLPYTTRGGEEVCQSLPLLLTSSRTILIPLIIFIPLLPTPTLATPDDSQQKKAARRSEHRCACPASCGPPSATCQMNLVDI